MTRRQALGMLAQIYGRPDPKAKGRAPVPAPRAKSKGLKTDPAVAERAQELAKLVKARRR